MIEVIWALVGAIFAAGVFYATTRFSIAQLRKDLDSGLRAVRGESAHEIGNVRGDLNKLGIKVREGEAGQQRRFHNISLAMVVIAPVDKEKEVCDFLREG
jgi:hypothetical protein